ncbi:MAG: hypothetical protein FJ025_03245 [Chloroflexi bacterium]|nr:hypothetical protein [Chloroflexota bacterium]
MTSVVFDARLGRHGGSRYRGPDGRFVPNPNRAKPWYCQKSPTSAHHWMITGQKSRCKYCRAEQEMSTSISSVRAIRVRKA